MGDLQTTTGNNLPSTLNQRLSEVTEQLQPASGDAVASAVLKMARAGLAYPPGLDATRAGDIYGFACKGVSIEALKLATMKVIQGEVPDINRNFIPTPPAFAAIVKGEARVLWQDRERILASLDAISQNKPVPPSEESRARVRAMLQSFKQQHEGAKVAAQAGLPVEIPEERAARLRRILALPDAPGVTSEQINYRRVVQANLPEIAALEPATAESDKSTGHNQQQKEIENGEGSQTGAQIHSDGLDLGRPEGQQERPFGFEND